MRLVVSKRSMQLALRRLQHLLFACAAVLLGYCAFVLTDAWRFQRAETQRLERLLHEEHQTKEPQPKTALGPATLLIIGPDGLIGRMEILRLSISVVVVEGTEKPTLRRAAGHIFGTALPGELGNVGIAAHRDTFFWPLRNIQLADMITLTTLRGEYRYRVVSIKVVSPSDVAVLDSDGHEMLTLVTCYPFYFVGPAPNRFIVRAERIN
ncbi:MAG TPA: class D sortase [Myxococcaceae bacterium]|nr:class D sortase [Myxococcaceae bacterium]